MFRHGTDESPRRSTALQKRATIVTGIAIAIFSVIGLRLWYLQILSGDSYRDQANDNRVREVRVQAPRGEILDRDGKVLVANRTELALQVLPDDLPKLGSPQRAAVMKGLAQITGDTPQEMEAEIAAVLKESRASPVILARGLGAGKVYFLREHQDRFPGVSVERVFAREYRQGSVAAHLFGNVGEVTAEQLGLPRYATLDQGDQVGQSGIEYEYDRYLRGRAGSERFQVDALGRPTDQLNGRPAHAGDNVRLTIDADLQATAEGALGSFGLPGAFVAMNVDSGEVLAMGSAPSFDPSVFTRPITERQYKALVSRENDAPLANRAIQGLYPTGSIFKVITGLAALNDGLITPGEIVNDSGEVKVDTVTFKNAQDAVFGPIDMSDAFKVSSDVYFYKLGYESNVRTGRGGVIQAEARQLGLGEQTGIDLPAEVEGLVPTPAWRNRLFRDKLTDRPWSAGDNINFAVGQGDMQADPLQMAVVYAAIANGGTVLRPHLGERVETATGEVLEEFESVPKRQVEIPEEWRSTILNGLTRAAMEEGGTSYPVFGNFPVPIAGKTGTAERGIGVADQAWYAAVAPANDPEIVVVVTLERGGFGADSAAPAAARILEKYFQLPITPAVASAQESRE
ncbi:MAG TPA: penicillin-binding protein 2 [Solirubrobacterales bacterium]|jgi:penicillin-binding protein 2|nr:penicillin-binding protein 2 [Solirubrobacterales bacterium]